MVIGPFLRPQPIVGGNGPQSSTGGGFSVSTPVDAPSAASVDTIRTMSPVGGSMMLALQEHTGQDAADREAKRHGQDMIAELAALQHALLSGTKADTVGSLSRMVQIELRGVHPALAQVLSSIRLRARIELERLSKECGSRS